MFSIFSALLRDEAGYVLCAESVVLGTVGIVGATVGLSAISHSINEELKEMAFSIRSLDQSYCYQGMSGCGSSTSGSTFLQMPVEQAHEELQFFIDEREAELQREADDGKKEVPAKKKSEVKSEKKKSDDGKKKPQKGAKNKDARWDDNI